MIEKVIRLLFGIVLLAFIASCQKSPEERVTELTTKLFQFVHDDKSDSINIIYPSLDINLLPIHSDSISIKSVKELSDGKLEVEIVNNYSELNSDEANIKTNISLFYEKSDSSDYGYIIADSRGIYNRDGLAPFDAERSGCIDPSKKYTDNEYIRRFRIAEKIQDAKSQEVANLLNSNVKVLVYNESVIGNLSLPIVHGNVARFTLENPTDYSCQGFIVYLELKNSWDGKYQGKFDGLYDYGQATLQAHSRNNYSMSIDPSKLKNSNSSFNDYISSAKFETTAKYVKENTFLKYSGNEYDEYMKKNNNNI